MVKNIPVENVLDMHAAVVIAVALGLPPGNTTQLETITGVLRRSVEVMITQNEGHSLALANATVHIGTGGYDGADYTHVKKLVELGYRTASAQSVALLPYAIQNPAEWRGYLAARAARRD